MSLKRWCYHPRRCVSIRFRPRRLLFGLVFFVCWFFLFAKYLEPRRVDTHNYDVLPKTYANEVSRENFIRAAALATLEDSFDRSAIYAVCAAAPWDPKIVFKCEGARGGMGNVKQILLNCIRYAIDAGASIILPSVGARDDSNLTNLDNGWTGIEYLFDKQRFLGRMGSACPQLRIYGNEVELLGLGPVTITKSISIETSLWFGAVTSARRLVKKVRARKDHISLIPFEKLHSYYPVCNDHVDFADSFGQLLPFRKDAHQLAAHIIYTLITNFNIRYDATKLISPHPSFLGVHLRTGDDNLPGWPTYAEQASYHLQRIVAHQFDQNVHCVYLASDNATTAAWFRDEIKALNPAMQVVTKSDMLTTQELLELQAMTWDQQALVDYLVLLRGQFFHGVAESSFSWAVAMKRRQLSKRGTCGTRTGLWSGYLWGSAFEDESNDVLGPHPFGWEIRMWP